jgi:bifunctional oligoribonuclease and PAP phosphatase NrnA
MTSSDSFIPATLEAGYRRAAGILQSANTLCIASHYGPDGDAIGSTLALGLGLLQLGKKVTLFNVDGVPNNLRFLPQSERIIHQIGPRDDFDLLVLVDCAQPSRAGKPIEDLAKEHEPYLIDHHILPGIDDRYHCIDPQAAATGDVVFNILRQMGSTITPEIAECVYCTLVTDTGQFQYSNTTPYVLRRAAECVDLGADPWHISSNIFEQQPLAAIKLLRLALRTLLIEGGGRYAHMTLTQEMLREADAIPEHAEEFVGYPRSLAGVEVASLFRELPDGRWKVSLRSKRYVDVAAIASLFAGGGHEHAAGCTLEGGLMGAREQVARAVQKALSRRQSLQATGTKI